MFIFNFSHQIYIHRSILVFLTHFLRPTVQPDCKFLDHTQYVCTGLLFLVLNHRLRIHACLSNQIVRTCRWFISFILQMMHHVFQCSASLSMLMVSIKCYLACHFEFYIRRLNVLFRSSQQIRAVRTKAGIFQDLVQYLDTSELSASRSDNYV